MASPSSSSSKLRLVIIAVVALLVVGGGAFWYLTRDDAPEELRLQDDPVASTTTAAGSPDGSTTTAGGPATAGLDGEYGVVPGSGDEATVAGYRVEEVFAAGARRNTAAGRTGSVTGSVTVAGGMVTAAKFEVDTTTLKSDESRRDNRIKGDGLETDQFPTATFELTEPVTLPELPEGKVVELKGTGDLTLHGVTKSVSIDLQVKARGDTFVVSGNAPVAMADYGINPPSIGGFVEVDDHGSFEFIVNLQRS
jgi:polyisoprenoid-binding protein YceI